MPEPEPECPLHPEDEPRRPVRYAYCSLCCHVVRSAETCPRERRRPIESAMDTWQERGPERAPDKG